MVFATLLLVVAGLAVLGVLSRQFGAGAGLSEFGKGIQELISRPLSPTIEPRFEVQLGPNLQGLIDWIQDAWAGVMVSSALEGPQIPIIPPTIPKIPTLPTIPIWDPRWLSLMDPNTPRAY